MNSPSENIKEQTTRQSLSDDLLAVQIETERGNQDAQFHLGCCLLNGDGVDKNEIDAFNCFARLALQNYTLAQVALAECYHTGIGRPKNERKVFLWHKRAARRGDRVGQFNLSLNYEYGRGTEQDIKECLFWLEQAANNGHANAQYNWGYRHLMGEDVLRDIALGIEWLEKAAAKGHQGAKDDLKELQRAAQSPISCITIAPSCESTCGLRTGDTYSPSPLKLSPTGNSALFFIRRRPRMPACPTRRTSNVRQTPNCFDPHS
jgi:TPR repeat protein